MVEPVGAELILIERRRQIDEEGKDAEYDDKLYSGELLRAAQAYIEATNALRSTINWVESTGPRMEERQDTEEKRAQVRVSIAEGTTDPYGYHYGRDPDDASLNPPESWPFTRQTWKPGSAIRNLEKAGAFIAAELDRLIRAGS